MNTSELGGIALAICPSAICAAAAMFMAITGIEGWGWFLFGAFVLYPSLRTGKAAEIEAQRELEESRREK